MTFRAASGTKSDSATGIMLRQPAKGLLVIAAILLFTATGWSQAIFTTLTGVVTDPTGAVVPQAKITLRNGPSGDIRNTTADHQRYYTFASVSVGTHNLTVIQSDFQTFQDNAIPLGGGGSRSVSVSLQLGSTSQTANAPGETDILTPVDSGERTMTLATEQPQNYAQTGSDATRTKVKS
jgi:hypothetical protein